MTKRFIERIKALATETVIKGKKYLILTYQDEMTLSSDIYEHFNKRIRNSLQIVQLEALKNGIIPTRYLDNVINIGIENQIKLLESKVAVVGIGRLGSHIVENLARLGVGHILLVDAAQIEGKSLNSQSIALPEYLNVNRTTVMSMRVHDINSGVHVEMIDEQVTAENVDSILKDYTYVVSSSNVFATHEMLSEYCKEKEKVLVYGTLNGSKGFVLSLFPDNLPFSTLYNHIEKECDEGDSRTTLSHVTAIIAGYQTSEIVDVITKGKSKHPNQVFKIDVENLVNEVL